MYRTKNCGELRTENIGQNVTLAGWVQKVRDKGSMIWIDLRDRYGLTQLVLENEKSDPEVIEIARKLGREFVIQVNGDVVERYSKNPDLPTGDIEIKVNSIVVLNESKVPPFTIEKESDGGEELRMKYRYLDLRRSPLQESLKLRHQVMRSTRSYMDSLDFMEIETPVLIKSTPEGARDFVVPSRVHEGEFYALPQSPQTFKQLLMVSGYDKYYQIVKCFRDEDLRADRQPEFTQIDCEMSFIEQEDILQTFEGLMRRIFKDIKSIELPEFKRMTFAEAMEKYGNDKPDLRFGMEIQNLNSLAQGKGFQVFDKSEVVLAIKVEGAAEYTRKQIDALTEWVKRPQIGAGGLVYVKYQEDGALKSSVDKFFDETALKTWADQCEANPGDLLLVLSGNEKSTRFAMSELRLEMGNQLGLRDKNTFAPLWVIDFPLLDWDEESKRFYAMHHPFTSPKAEDIKLLENETAKVRANAYDMVINGVELGGGSIRIHNRQLQEKMFEILGFTEEEARSQFGFLMDAFEFGAPPHGGIAFGFDRICAMLGGSDSIRDYIAFPKNNAGRDVMINTPSPISEEQLNELHLKVKLS